MYRQYFGMRELPFSPTPNTAFYVDLAGHREAVNVVLVALRGGEGVVKITGEVGTGKTLLCQQLTRLLRKYCVTIHLDGPELGPFGLQLALADQLGTPLPGNTDSYTMLKHTKEILIDVHRRGQRTIMLVDEAQILSRKSLETLRLLGNLQNASRRLLQVVLVGQPELDRHLAQPSLRQLRQRIAFSHRLKPIDRRELRSYITRRLAVAGYRGGELFGPSATTSLHRASRGIPRLVNTLCHKSLMLAYSRGDTFVSSRHVRRAAADTTEARGWIRLRLPLLLPRGSAPARRPTAADAGEGLGRLPRLGG